ncbi:unnamed protein product [Candidula unifasciata]|uniref:Protein FAM228B n=1 Tax=Candidula unifasciata TaxID=100452 RepID=A0A8S4A4D9_9EUPU|nr:unnamed protein product [Candidula unifasciata]
MRSMIYQKKAGGTVKVHKRDTVDQIVDDGIREKTQLDLFKRPKHIKRQGPRALSAPASTVSLGSGSQSNQSAKTQDWLNESTIIELQKKAINESHATKQLYTNFMETERTFVKSLEDYLTHKEFTDLRKKELLHKRWTEEVYEPIRKKILDTIDKSDRNETDYLKREKHRKFLEHLNKKGVVFLDGDDREESSVEAVNSLGKVKTKPLLDPLHTESRQRTEDEKTILLCMTGHHYTNSDLRKVRLPLLSPGARSVTMPCYSIENMPRNKNRCSVYGNSAKTSFDFRSWAMAAQELQIPHKRMFAEQPPFGKPPVVLPKVPFIDPEDFADKIVNTNPFNLHMANLKAEVEAMKEFFQIQQQADVEQKELLNQDNQQKI